jgi:hypothetical protein
VTQDVPPRIFIGSSSESLRVAQGIKANLEELAEVRIWNEGLFTPGRYTLEELLGFTGSFDFAIFIWNSDDSLTSRGSQFTVARDNVVLETGVFYGVLGRERVFLCAPQSLRVRTPSDLLGMKVLSFQEPSDGNYRSATSSASSEVAAHVRTLGPMPRTMAAGDDLAEIAVYESFLTARQDITRACIKAQAIKIFANKGLAFFGLDDSSISLAEVREYSRLRRIRVLLMDPESPWISNGFIALRHYESIASYKRELESSHAILPVTARAWLSQPRLSRQPSMSRMKQQSHMGAARIAAGDAAVLPGGSGCYRDAAIDAARWSITARASSSMPQMKVDRRRRSMGRPSA